MAIDKEKAEALATLLKSAASMVSMISADDMAEMAQQAAYEETIAPFVDPTFYRDHMNSMRANVRFVHICRAFHTELMKLKADIERDHV